VNHERERVRPTDTVPRLRPRSWLLACSLLTLVSPSSSCTRAEPSEAQPNEPAPAFESTSLDGDPVALSDYEGKVILLNFWATWCEPCVRELPELVRMHELLEPKGFTVIGINNDVRSKRGPVRAMVIRHRLPYPTWFDFESRAQVVFKLRGYPTSILIDRHGQVRWRREGEILRNDPELTPILEAVLAE
jgi:thiol-disulfide isomerase/thioredoxin